MESECVTGLNPPNLRRKAGLPDGDFNYQLVQTLIESLVLSHGRSNTSSTVVETTSKTAERRRSMS
jgi:hypothetical protein